MGTEASHNDAPSGTAQEPRAHQVQLPAEDVQHADPNAMASLLRLASDKVGALRPRFHSRPAGSTDLLNAEAKRMLAHGSMSAVEPMHL